MSARGHSLDNPAWDEFAVHACFLNVPVAASFQRSSEINLMSVHGIVEQYPGGPYPSQSCHNAESNVEATELRALSTKGYFKSMLNASATFPQNLFEYIAKKNGTRKK